MDEKEKNQILTNINELIEVKFKSIEKNSDNHFHLLLQQLELFRNISALSLVIFSLPLTLNTASTIGNIYFTYTSIFFSFITLVGTLAYNRETIDLQAKQREEALKEEIIDIDTDIIKLKEAYQKEDINLWYSHAQSRVDEFRQPVSSMSYAGEIFAFCFYSSIFFGVFAFFKGNNFDNTLLLIMFIIIISYLLAFKNWSSVILVHSTPKCNTCHLIEYLIWSFPAKSLPRS